MNRRGVSTWFTGSATVFEVQLSSVCKTHWANLNNSYVVLKAVSFVVVFMYNNQFNIKLNKCFRGIFKVMITNSDCYI